METCLKGIAEHFPLTEKELRGYSSLGLAYIGDCIYELFVRTMVVTKGNDKANHYHQKTISYVNAAAQTAMMEKIKPLLTDEEKAEQEDVTVQTYLGEKPHEAQSKIRNAGLKTEIIGQGTSVLKQIPEPGKTLPYGGTVILYTDQSEADSIGTVPDVVGRSVSDANQMITNAGFNINIVGEVPEGQEEIVITQDPPAGSTAETGSIITVSLEEEQPAEQTSGETTGEPVS